MFDAVPERALAERRSVAPLLRALATLGAALMLVVIASSAYLRLEAAGLACVHWPACDARAVASTEAAGAATPTRAARLAHRVAASAVAAVLLALLLIPAVQRPILKQQAAIAGVGMLIAAALAVLGAATRSDGAALLPAVTLMNLSGGFALFALLRWLRLTTLPDDRRVARPAAWIRALARVALIATIVDVLLGALVSADVASLNLAHGIGGVAVLLLVVSLAFVLTKSDASMRRSTIALGCLAVLQVLLSAVAVLAKLTLPIVLAHNVVAALLLVALVGVNWELRSAAMQD